MIARGLQAVQLLLVGVCLASVGDKADHHSFIFVFHCTLSVTISFSCLCLCSDHCSVPSIQCLLSVPRYRVPSTSSSRPVRAKSALPRAT